MQRGKNQGFTLFEMSLVLVIIGLIIGGIVISRNVVRQAQLATITSEIKNYEMEINQFKEKYGGLPGDFTEGSVYWPTCTTIGAGGPLATCNGNSNGLIEGTEMLLAWRHLSLAQMVPGTFRGDYDTFIYPGDNIPTSKVEDTAYKIGNHNAWSVSKQYNVLHVGFFTPGLANSSVGLDAFTPIEMKAMDEKMDDGQPHLGQFLSFGNPDATLCTGGTDPLAVVPATVNYDIDTDSNLCVIIYNLGFKTDAY